ncbi:MAG: hypothetical protein ACQEV6_00695 [Pseudomonadota bacterium]
MTTVVWFKRDLRTRDHAALVLGESGRVPGMVPDRGGSSTEGPERLRPGLE